MQQLIRGYVLLYPNNDFVAIGDEGYPRPVKNSLNATMWPVVQREQAALVAKKFPRAGFSLRTIEYNVTVGE